MTAPPHCSDSVIATPANSGDLEKAVYAVQDGIKTIRVDRMRHKMTIDTLKGGRDPLDHYLRQAPDDNDPLWKQIKGRSFYYTAWTKYVKDSSAWTASEGQAFLIIIPPPHDYKPEGPIDKLLLALLGLLATGHSKEHTERLQEFMDKLGKSVRKSLGDRAKDMLSIAALMNLLDEHRSYATALVQTVNDKADSEGRAVKLINSHIEGNTEFYNSMGYHAVDRFWLGGDNPAWDEPPIPIDLMVREPESPATNEKIKHAI
ncbi:hypothetical protein NM688_g6330 [Phlebia brevispora]|uniref:Uncharacterized protein n=1 Tax=Phlebia brevispora TaxID=194682 RepID=A0ACC1SH47_9APHY|nr:hypothetical protein NM688_g6330 [Phlebia brevispora]